jgi:hypothetical protein
MFAKRPIIEAPQKLGNETLQSCAFHRAKELRTKSAFDLADTTLKCHGKSSTDRTYQVELPPIIDTSVSFHIYRHIDEAGTVFECQSLTRLEGLDYRIR